MTSKAAEQLISVSILFLPSVTLTNNLSVGGNTPLTTDPEASGSNNEQDVEMPSKRLFYTLFLL